MKTYTKTVLTYTAPVLMGIALIVSVVWGKAQSVKAKEYERLSDEYALNYVNSCERCGRELYDAADEMALALEKLRVTASKEGRVLALEDIVRAGERAASCEGRLPQSCVKSLGVSAFFTRAADYAGSLSKKLLEGGELEESDIAQLSAVLASCREMAKELARRIAEGEMPTGTEEFDYYGEAGEDDRTEPELPTLIYDGPFSESAEKAEPLGVTGEEGTPAEAKRIAERIAGEEMLFSGTTEGRLPTFDFRSKGGGKDVSITKKGLWPLYFMSGPKCDSEGLPDEEEYERLVKTAEEFLASLGYESMAPTYGEYREGYALISFVWERSGVLVYNDMIKVRLDRETGEPIGLDARNYLFSHREREWEEPAVSSEKAKEAVSKNLSVTGARLALIPLTPQKEALCWEFTGAFSDTEYVVYVNANTGREEQIFRIVNDGCGKKAE